MSLANSSGFKFYFDSLNMNPDLLFCAFDFVSGSGFTSTPRRLDFPGWYTTGEYKNRGTGIINGSISSTFYRVASSGFFNGAKSSSALSNSITITGVNLPEDGFSFLFSFDRSRNPYGVDWSEEILLSTARGSVAGAPSGFSLGINRANKLYLEYWDKNDRITSFTSTLSLYDKNIVALKKGFGNFYVGVIDQSDLKFKSEFFPILNDNYVHSNEINIANCSRAEISNSSFWSRSDHSFGGFFDDFYLLSGFYSDDYLDIFSSGLYSDFLSGSFSGTQTGCAEITIVSGSGYSYTGITGYKTVIDYITGYVLTGYYESGYSKLVGTGVTGYLTETFSYVDNCDQPQSITKKTPITGPIYTYGFTGIYTGGYVPVVTEVYSNETATGIISGVSSIQVSILECSQIDVYNNASFFIDSGFIASLGPNRITSVSEASGDFIEAFIPLSYTEQAKDVNIISQYSNINSDFQILDKYSGLDRNLVFKNGQLLFNGPTNITQVGGVNYYNISGGNIYIDDQNIIRSNGFNQPSDFISYDYSSGFDIKYYSLEQDSEPGFSLYSSLGVDSGYLIFKNGIKLAPQEDYTSNGLSLVSGISGSIYLAFKSGYLDDNRYFYFRGSRSLDLTGSGQIFLKNSSQVYRNGLREYPGNGYLEGSVYNLLDGCPTVKSNNLIYSTSLSENFWNI
jgi:hypothetical protein